MEWELRLQFTWVPGTRWQGTGEVGLLDLGAGVNAWGAFHNLHHCFISMSKM